MPIKKHFNPALHPRGPKGSPLGGKFVAKMGDTPSTSSTEIPEKKREYSFAEAQKFDKLHREYKAYLKLDKRSLMSEYLRSNRVSSIESELKYLSKDNLASDIMRQKWGNKTMDDMWAWVDAGKPFPRLTDEQAEERLGRL